LFQFFIRLKNLGGAGDGGMVITSNTTIEKNLRQLRDHGQSGKYQFNQLGYNSRLDEIQAAVLRIKFRRLDQWINKRRNIAKLYVSQLKDISEIVCPIEIPNTKHVYNLFTISAKKRDKLREFFTKGRNRHSGPLPLSVTHTKGIFLSGI
jgi:UDP-2-acetamido-2-deoxy-ribo-hexuluronate aminotransferase